MVIIWAPQHLLFCKTSLESCLFYLIGEDCYPQGIVLASCFMMNCISVPLLNHLCVNPSKTVLKDKNWLWYQTAWQITPNSMPYFPPCFSVGSKTLWGWRLDHTWTFKKGRVLLWASYQAVPQAVKRSDGRSQPRGHWTLNQHCHTLGPSLIVEGGQHSACMPCILCSPVIIHSFNTWTFVQHCFMPRPMPSTSLASLNAGCARLDSW